MRDSASVAAFARAAGVAKLDLLVNNAGGALGLDRVENAPVEQWREMYEMNFLSIVRLVRAFLPALRASGEGHIVNVGSIAGFETYAGGGGYTGAKHAVRALTAHLAARAAGRADKGDRGRPGPGRNRLFAGPLRRRRRTGGRRLPRLPAARPTTSPTASSWAASRPSHVNIDEIVVRPRAQATATQVHKT